MAYGRLGDIVIPSAFGAYGNGADETAQLQAAITAAEGKTLDLQGKTYITTSRIDGTSDMHIRNGAIDHSGAPSNSRCLVIEGSQDTSITLTGDASEGDFTLTMSDTSTLSAGDWLVIESDFLWATFGSTNVTPSEWARVLSVDSATQVTVYDRLRRDYLVSDSARASRIALKSNIFIDRLDITGSDTALHSQYGISARYCSNVRVDGCRTVGLDHTHVEFFRSRDCRVKNLVASRARGNGVGYGITAATGCDGFFVDGCIGEYFQHFVTTGGSTGVNSGVSIRGSRGIQCRRAAFETHGGCDDILISECIVHCMPGIVGGGIASDGARTRIVGNTVFGSDKVGILCQPAQNAGVPITHVIEGNTVVGSNLQEVGVQVKTPIGTGNSGPILSAKVVGNTIENTSNYGVFVYSQGTDIDNITVAENTVVIGHTGRGIAVRADADRSSRSCTVSGNQVDSTQSALFVFKGITGGQMSDFSITDNPRLDSSSGYGIEISAPGAPLSDFARFRYEGNHAGGGISVDDGTDFSEGTNWNGVEWTGGGGGTMIEKLVTTGYISADMGATITGGSIHAPNAEYVLFYIDWDGVATGTLSLDGSIDGLVWRRIDDTIPDAFETHPAGSGANGTEERISGIWEPYLRLVYTPATPGVDTGTTLDVDYVVVRT